MAASIPIFETEYSEIGNVRSLLWCYFSAFKVSYYPYRKHYGCGEENSEKFVYLRSSHGICLGVKGYLKVSVEVMGMCLTPDKHEGFIEHPFPLITQFVYPTLLSKDVEEMRRDVDKQARREEVWRRDEDEQTSKRK
ncbi:unnamed protein product [Arabis nemorensis]|uniref:Uncharacterized protein n=1 Tax=Arabis nemorensis TaxID=586526 RepID=A0A565B143_9BRAS|nr:unnamed protein product [Arabis nemorensis]